MATTTKLTYDDLDCLLDDDGNRYEIIDGEVVVSPRPLIVHQWISQELSRRIDNHVQRRKLGRIFVAPTAIILSPHDVFEPDLIYVSNARMMFVSERGIEGPPDLCIEIASPSTRKRDRTTKYDRYAHFGVPEYWIVDPLARTTEVFVFNGTTYASQGITSGSHAVPSQVLPNLRLRVASLFPPA